MNAKAVIPLIAGLGIGGFALKIGIDTLQKAKGGQSSTVTVWAAKGDIPRGSSISSEMLTSLNFPANLTLTGAFRQKDQLVGRVPRVDAPGGLPILESMLLGKNEPAGLHIPPGFRAVGVKIDESSGVDFHLEPGSKVDVVGYFTVRDRGKQQTVARTLIENVEVAAVGARISPVSKEGDEKGGRPTRAVTLLVRPESVPLLHLAEQRGKIKLSMRGGEDADLAGTEDPVNEDELLQRVTGRPTPESNPATAEQNAENGGMFTWLKEAFAKAAQNRSAASTSASAELAPVPRPESPAWCVRVYRGDNVEVVRFKNRNSHERADPAADEHAPRRGASYTPPTQRGATGAKPDAPARPGAALPKTVPAPAGQAAAPNAQINPAPTPPEPPPAPVFVGPEAQPEEDQQSQESAE